MLKFLQETGVAAYVKISSRGWCCSLYLLLKFLQETGVAAYVKIFFNRRGLQLILMFLQGNSLS